MAAAVRAVGALSSGTTGAVSVAAPTGIATGDLEILVASTIAGGSLSITTAGGGAWTAHPNSPQDVTAGEKLYVWWRIRAGGDTNPSVTPGSDHSIAARIAIYAGTFDPTTPFEATATGSEATSDTSFSFATGVSTTAINGLCMVFVSSGVDIATSQGGTNTANTNLSAVTATPIINFETANGLGGGFFVATGILATPGAVGTWTNTMVSATPKAYLAWTVRPFPVTSTFPNTPLLDNFNTGASQALTARAGWSATGHDGATDASYTTDVTPTQAVSAAGTTSNLWGSSLAADQEVWTKWGSIVETMILFAREDQSGNARNVSGYLAKISDLGLAQILDGGSGNPIASSQLTAPATGDMMGFQLIGSVLVIWYKKGAGAWLNVLAVNNTLFAGGASGPFIGMIGQSGGFSRVDEFGGGSIVTFSPRNIHVVRITRSGA